HAGGDPNGSASGRGIRAPNALPLRTTLRISAQAAAEAILGNKLRSALTILGVVMGVASVIVLIAFGQGARQEVISQIYTLGTNVAVVVPGKNRGEPGFNPLSAIGVSNLTPADVEALRRVPGVVAVSPLMFVGGVVYRAGRPAKVCMPIATTPELAAV